MFNIQVILDVFALNWQPEPATTDVMGDPAEFMRAIQDLSRSNPAAFAFPCSALLELLPDPLDLRRVQGQSTKPP